MQYIPTYFPSIRYMAALMNDSSVNINLHCHYQKQTYRNRCKIYGANGPLNLTIPIRHTKSNEHQKDGNVKIMWEQDWQKQHWKSLTSAYRSSPFFEFYEDELQEVFYQQPENLMEYNLNLISCLLSWLEADINFIFADQYIKFTADENRLIQAKNMPVEKLPYYTQVFENKYGFIANLSVIDLIFNLGPQSRYYLENLVQSQPN